MKLLILNADDLGICEETNLAILKAHREGMLTSASLMANGPSFEHAVEEVLPQCPDLGVGLHVALTSGASVSDAAVVPDLVDDRGCFRRGFASLGCLASTRARVRRQIEREVEAQFARLSDAGVRPGHVDGHRHVHMIPPVFHLVSSVARRHGCPSIRLSHEPRWRVAGSGRMGSLLDLARNLPKKVVLSGCAWRDRPRLNGLSSPGRVLGVMDSGGVTRAALHRLLTNLPDGVTELLTHPGLDGPQVSEQLDPGDQQFLKSRGRVAELEALIDPELQQLCDENEIRRVRYDEWRTALSPAPPATPATAT